MQEAQYDIIAGAGNILLSDDGLGIHVIRCLEKEKWRGRVEIIDMGTSSMDLGYYLNRCVRKMVIIDAMRSGQEPGTVYRMRPEDLVCARKQDFSLHQLKLVDTLRLTALDTSFPDTIIIGITPHDTDTFSEHLSTEVKKRFPDIYKTVLEAVKEFLYAE